MRTNNQKDVGKIFVGKNVTSALGADVLSLVDGEVGIFNGAGVRLTNITFPTTNRFKIVANVDGELLQSGMINKADIVKVTNAAYAAPAEQTTYIGYDGTSGAITVNSSTVYRISLMIKETIVQNHGGVYVKDMTYKSDPTATQEEIAFGLVKSGIRNLEREAEQPMYIRAISDAVLTNVLTTAAATSGSNYITLGAAFAGVVGDVIVVGGGHYKVEAIVGNAVKINMPYQGPSINAASYDWYNAAAAATANWGIFLQGKPLAFRLGRFNYKKARWNIALDSASFGTTPVVNTPASEGRGTYEQIAEQEWFEVGNFGEFFRVGEPNIFPAKLNAVAGETYDQYVLEIAETEKSTLQVINNPMVITVAAPSAGPNWATDATYGTSILLATL